MKKTTKRALAISGVLLAANIFSTVSFAAFQKPKIGEGIDYWANMRYRYENVQQDTIHNDAKASTFRVRLGASYKPIEQIKILAELETNTPLGVENYNSTTNGKTSYPVVADPASTELNRAEIIFTNITDTILTIGRQRIILDNARFIGNVGWRQNEQTFDSVLFTNKYIKDTELTAGYIWNVHRIFGSQSDKRKFDSDNTWIFNGKYNGYNNLSLIGYGYLLDIKENSALSSKTFGVRAVGKYPIDNSYKLLYTVELANQTDRANNPNKLDANYYNGRLGLGYKNLSVIAGYESLDGNGVAGSAFQTPLATLHGQNGWADKFLTTPNNGLDDVSLTVKYKQPVLENKIMGAIKFTAVYHDFSAQNTNTDYGTEFDAIAASKFFDTLNVAVKYASYNKDTFSADTNKFWFQVGMNF